MADDKLGIIQRLVDGVLQRPFTEAMALITTLTLISLGVYELKYARPELQQQAHENNVELQKGYERSLDRVIQAEEKRTDLFIDIMNRQSPTIGAASKESNAKGS